VCADYREILRDNFLGGGATRENLREFYKMAIPAESIARAIAYAIEQPAEVEIDEVVIRPTAQDF
jgi:NADP-dependent 3-hydroxy acid dehydrogenase YdfG